MRGVYAVETRIDGFDLSARFTFLARLGCYPSHAVRGMHAGWHNRLFANIQTMRGIAAIRRSVAAGVHFGEPQRFEDFFPAHPYDALMLNNLFMYMTRAQMDASFAVIGHCRPRLIVFTRGSDHRRTAHLQDGLTALGFVGINDHTSGRASALGDANRQLYPFYIVMAHKDAGFTPVRATALAYVVQQP